MISNEVNPSFSGYTCVTALDLLNNMGTNASRSRHIRLSNSSDLNYHSYIYIAFK